MLGERIKAAREALKIRQAEVSRRSGVSKPYISEIERGHRKSPSYEILRKLARALETTVEYLYGEVEANPSRRCETCEFFREGEWDTGTCHRYPPQVMLKKIETELDHRLNPIYDDLPHTFSPELHKTDFCGEWRLR